VADLLVLGPGDDESGVVPSVRSMVVEAFAADKVHGAFDDDDWEHGMGGWRVVLVEDGAPVSTAAVVRRLLQVGGRPFQTGYVEAVATRRGRQGEGLGSRVMERATGIVRERFEMGALGTGRYRFYERLGWERWRGPSFVRRGDELVRTPEDDDGLMVLRFGASADVDLTAPIACEERPGDDW